ncbi:MAG TPA: TonB-dependent receptor [Pyrinomonadaceae bacterium]|nr:TonB-dependent receptor [Pyrinomonadaceae bacterium]
MPRKLLCCLLLVLCLSSARHDVAAQQAGSLAGSLKGTVTDQLGSLVVGAKVTLRNASGRSLSATSNSSGVYEFKRVEPGTYELQVIAPGFNLYEEKEVAIRARETTIADAQLTIALEDQQVTVDDRNMSTDSDNNANAVVLRGRELEALPNDPQALASALQALAGPPDQESGGTQIKVDGFSDGQIPPKEAIREVRVNNNPFSAENEFPGFSGIEIFTQPGSEKWHGAFSYDFNDESLNSRNPFTTVRAPYQQRAFNISLSGPIVAKRASFSAYFGRWVSDGNSVVNATTLDLVTLKPVVINQSFITPDKSINGNGRLDFKVNKIHTVVGRFNFNQSSQDLQGIGGFSLPSRAYRGRRSNFTLQITETALLNERTVNETRFQYIRNRFNQTSLLDEFALNVAEAFSGGGSQVGASSNAQNRMELTNFTSWTRGNHFLKVGARVRHVDIDSISPGNFGGTYTFAGGRGPKLDENDQIIPGPDGKPQVVDLSSLERYRRTLAFSRARLSASATRLLGGGATQFSIAGGDPQTTVKQTDVSFYIQDEWKLRPNFTISPGLRYENQTNIHSNDNFGPRIAFAWSPVFSRKKAAPAAAKEPAAAATTPATPATATTTTANTTTTARAATPAPAAPAVPAGPPKTVIRGGVGFFYNRVSEDLTLQAIRFNGTNQQQFFVTDPAVLDLFPIVPPIEVLDAFEQPQLRRVISDDLVPLRFFRAMITVERTLPKNVRLSMSYIHSRTANQQRLVNINAPIGGTFIPGLPNSGERPFGNEAGNILEYQSTGRSVGNSFFMNVNGTISKVNFFGGYSFGKHRNTDSGTSGSPSDAYDYSNEFARSNFNSLSFMHLGGNYTIPLGISLNLFAVANSGPPFNITTGRDTNGDTFFSERPAFATDLSEPGVVVTPYGAFDPTPSPGQQIIPRNYGRGPGFASISLTIGRQWKFGRAIEPKTPPPGAPRTTDASAPQTPPKPAPIQRPYSVWFNIGINNLFNRTNPAPPIGNMASPYFLKSQSGSSTFFFGPGGGASGNRVISLRVRVSF